MKVTFNKIAVIGLGYIGLPTAAILASRELNVVGVDIDENTVNIVNNGKVHIIEPDLDTLVHNVVIAGKLRAVTVPEAADVFLITVPTPITEDQQPDVSYVNAAIDSISHLLRKGNLIILESTSPVGTTDNISRRLAEVRDDLTFPHQEAVQPDIHIAYCAERVMPGQIIRELVENDRIIGGITPACTLLARSLYELFVKGKCISTNSRTAEMTKLTENSFRDVNIAFANELSIICEKLQINVWELITLANHHPRVTILQPGPGVGGHCIAVDPWFIVHSAPSEAKIIRAAREVNDSKPLFVLAKIRETAKGFTNPRLACLGITYKPNTDDLRESPVIKILQSLGDSSNFKIDIVEPNISALPANLQKYPQFNLVDCATALSNADIIVMMVAHTEFKRLDMNLLKGKTVIDLINLQGSQSTTTSALRMEPGLRILEENVV
ncbi:MAG: UDP-N-acetyl-D-mannosamine dehydrogenase [Pseudomonadota bacterium]